MGQSVQKIEDDGSSSAGVVAGVTLAIILLVAIILVVLYYKRRLKRLKDELAYVTYAADPLQSPDRRHFDNPVYAYQGVPPPGSSAPLNNTNTKHIYNDLGTKSNLAKAKLGEEDDDDCMTEKGACGGFGDDSELKSKLDFEYNPNIYHSIEDLKPNLSKKEPFYDEVKDRNSDARMSTSSDGNGNVYDHLQYNRPSTEMKPQYHRMGDTLTKAQKSNSNP